MPFNWNDDSDSDDETTPFNTNSNAYKVYKMLIDNPKVDRKTKKWLNDLKDKGKLLNYEELLTIHEREMMRNYNETNTKYDKLNKRSKADAFKKDLGVIMEGKASLNKDGKTYNVDAKLRVKKGLHSEVKGLLRNAIMNEIDRKLKPSSTTTLKPKKAKIEYFDVEFNEEGLNKRDVETNNFLKFVKDYKMVNNLTGSLKDLSQDPEIKNAFKNRNSFYQMPINEKEPRNKADKNKEPDYFKHWKDSGMEDMINNTIKNAKRVKNMGDIEIDDTIPWNRTDKINRARSNKNAKKLNDEYWDRMKEMVKYI